MSAEPDEILQYIRSMEKDVEAVENQIIDICYWMKGGITLNEGWALPHYRRQLIVTSLNEKIRKQSGDTREFM